MKETKVANSLKNYLYTTGENPYSHQSPFLAQDEVRGVVTYLGTEQDDDIIVIQSTKYPNRFFVGSLTELGNVYFFPYEVNTMYDGWDKKNKDFIKSRFCEGTIVELYHDVNVGNSYNWFVCRAKENSEIRIPINIINPLTSTEIDYLRSLGRSCAVFGGRKKRTIQWNNAKVGWEYQLSGNNKKFLPLEKSEGYYYDANSMGDNKEVAVFQGDIWIDNKWINCCIVSDYIEKNSVKKKEFNY